MGMGSMNSWSESNDYNTAQNGTYLFDYENTGTGVVTEEAATAQFLQLSSSGFCHRSIGDVNGDGFDDVEYASNCNNYPEVRYGGPDVAADGFTNTGLSLGTYMHYSRSDGGYWDYNGDGIQDALYSGYNTNAQVHFGDADFDDVVDVHSPVRSYHRQGSPILMATATEMSPWGTAQVRGRLW